MLLVVDNMIYDLYCNFAMIKVSNSNIVLRYAFLYWCCIYKILFGKLILTTIKGIREMLIGHASSYLLVISQSCSDCFHKLKLKYTWC